MSAAKKRIAISAVLLLLAFVVIVSRNLSIPEVQQMTSRLENGKNAIARAPYTYV